MWENEGEGGMMYEKYLDKGPWRVVTASPNEGGKTFLESDDFTHDARLYVSGDFATVAERELYAMALAKVLNDALRPPNPTPE